MNRPTLTHLARPVILALLFTTVLVLGASPSAWATPAQAPAGQSVPTVTPGGPTMPEITPPPTNDTAGATTQAVTPGIPTTVTSGATTLVLPADALREPGTLVVRSVAPDTLRTVSAGFSFLGKLAEIIFYDAQGNPIEPPTFANPILVCFDYSADDLAKAGGQPDNFLVQFYDTNAQKWVALPTRPEPARGHACGSVSHLALFALAARSSTPDVLPQTGLTLSEQTTQPSNGSFWWLIVVLAAAAGASIALVFRTRRARQS